MFFFFGIEKRMISGLQVRFFIVIYCDVGLPMLILDLSGSIFHDDFQRASNGFHQPWMNPGLNEGRAERA